MYASEDLCGELVLLLVEDILNDSCSFSAKVLYPASGYISTTVIDKGSYFETKMIPATAYQINIIEKVLKG